MMEKIYKECNQLISEYHVEATDLFNNIQLRHFVDAPFQNAFMEVFL